MNNEILIWNFFKSNNFSDYGIASIMGNLYAESGLNPLNLQNYFNSQLNYSDKEYTFAVDNNIYTNFVYDCAGYGLAQWTFWSKKQELLNYAKKNNSSIGNLNLQLNFLLQDLKNNYTNLYNQLKIIKDIELGSNLFLIEYERPADQSNSAKEKRISYAKDFFNKYGMGVKNMKYSDSNPPLQCIMTNSTCYKSTGKMQVKGILWHSTGANNTTLKRYVQPSSNDKNYTQLMNMLGKNQYNNDWNHIYLQAGVNAFIGKLNNGTVTTVQTLPWDYRPWGCGSGPRGSCNNGWIQFEICEDGLNDANYFNLIYKEACELTAFLCKKYNIDPKGTVTVNGVKVPTILCHKDSNTLGLGTAHADVLHWFPKFGKNMTTVRNDVQAILNGEDEEDMTQEKFDEMMNNWLVNLAKQPPSSWSANDRAWCEQNKIINGDNNGNMMYKKYVTREEMAAIIHRLYKLLT